MVVAENNGNVIYNTIHLINIQSVKSKKNVKLIELENHLCKFNPQFVLLN